MAGLPVRLPRLLSLLPRDGVGSSVYQTRWHAKGLPVPRRQPSDADDGSCRWDVERVKLNHEGDKVTGKAYGVMYWKGKRVTPVDKDCEEIKGALKYNWAAAVPHPTLIDMQLARKAVKAKKTDADK
ncbi:hypothetical protein OIO90_001178 [Microbotryomycetes sp. JL221]|nr:hypothetical protein OIO90_001178 [Microbotryomycetes sp. JL221]